MKAYLLCSLIICFVQFQRHGLKRGREQLEHLERLKIHFFRLFFKIFKN